MADSARSETTRAFAERTHGMSDAAFLEAALETFRGTIMCATSLGAEDQVLTDLLLAIDRRIPIVTLDTGRLPQETYDLIDATSRFFDVPIHVVFPDAGEVERFVRDHGVNGFYGSIEARRACCAVRKVMPLTRALRGYGAWITGMRRAQSPTRAGVERVEYDASHDVVKLNPLAEWTSEAVWERIRARGIPYNALHDKGYPSVGCLPCTRAVREGEDERAGRWWWERPEHRECGIHVHADRSARLRGEVRHE